MHTRFHIQTCCSVGSFIEVADVKELLAYSRSRHVELKHNTHAHYTTCAILVKYTKKLEIRFLQ